MRTVGEAKTLQRLYAGALDDQAWYAAIDAIIDDIGGETIFFGEADFLARKGGVISHRASDALIADFSGPLASPKVNPLHRAMPTMPVLQAIPTSRLCPDVEMAETPFYREGLEPHGLSYGVGTLFERDRYSASFAAVWRGRGGRDFHRDEVERLRRWLPHLATAVRLRLRVSPIRQRAERLAEALETSDEGWILMGDRGEITEANRIARAALAARHHLRSHGRHLCTAERADTPALAAAIRRAMQAECPTVVALRGRGSAPPLVMTLRPFAGDAAIVATFRGHATAEADRVPALVEAYGLTPAEARLAARLTRGDGLSAAARDLGVSINTAKKQCDAIFGKVGVARQVQLITRFARTGCSRPLATPASRRAESGARRRSSPSPFAASRTRAPRSGERARG